YAAFTRPLWPPPMTTTSYFCFEFICFLDFFGRGERRDDPVFRSEAGLQIRAEESMENRRVHDTGTAVFRFGLKNGILTTLAGTRCRTASTGISISSDVPGFACSLFTVASAISFFKAGDQVVEVALPD